MLTTDCATDIAPPGSESEIPPDPQWEPSVRTSDGASRPLKSLFFGFAATVTVGLALASWYVGVRIVAAEEVAPSSTIASEAVNSSPAPTPTPAPIAAVPEATVAPAAATPAVAQDSMAEAFWYTVPEVLYLQVAGLGPKQDGLFARSLQTKGFRAHVQSRDDGSGRILIGPFLTHAEMERTQRKLQSSGVLAVQTAP